MSLPVTIPFTFGNATTAQSLSSLDNNFTTIVNAVNGLTNGASQINVASISATGTANSTTYLRGDGTWGTPAGGGGGGNGTVTSVNANSTIGFSFTGGPVTSSGTLTLSGPAPGTSGNVLTSNGTAWISQASSAAGGVTSITAGTGLSGGTITTSGTIALVTTAGAVGTYALANNNSASTAFGGTIAGSALITSGLYISNPCSNPYTSYGIPGTTLSGTWQCMGRNSGTSGESMTLWIRIA